jgi:hypothetical protein
MDCWRAAAGHKLGRRAALYAAVTHFVKGAMAKAFLSWREWALHRAGLQRKARAYLSLLSGRQQGWAFAMLRCGCWRCPGAEVLPGLGLLGARRGGLCADGCR